MPEPPDAAPVRSGKPRPIAIYLLFFALVALGPAFAFSAILLQRNNEAQEQVVRALTVATTRAIIQSIDRDISGMVSTLRALASSPAMTTQDLEDIYRRAEAVLSGTGNYLVLINDRFEALLNTRVAFGTPLPPIVNTDNLKAALETNKPVIGDVAFSQTAQTWVVPVLVPHRADDGSAQVVALTQNAAGLQSVLIAQQMPGGWQVALVDRHNQVIVASDEATAPTGDPFFMSLDRTQSPSSQWGAAGQSSDARFVTTSSTSALTGWTAVAWAPRSIIDRPLADAVWSLVYGGALLAALVAIAIMWISNRIASSVRGLAGDARRLGSGQPVPVRDYPISEVAVVSAALGEASRQRLADEAEVRFLLRELAHRSKNQMTVIAAMAKQTARSAETVADFVQSFEKRIFGLARSTDLLLANGAQGVDLGELLTGQIDPFCPLDSGRVTLSGPKIRLNTQSAQILGMAAHEMATNAVKFGAFADDDGTLAVAWTRAGDRLQVSWRERGGGTGRPAGRRGFGTVVLENMVGQSLGATVVREAHDDGLEWRFDIPFEAIDPRLSGDARPGEGGSA